MTTTVAGTDVILNVRSLVSDTDENDYEFSPADMELFLTKAMREYSRLAPYNKTWSFVLSANVDTYSLPVDVVKVQSCDYRPFPGMSQQGVVAFFNALYGTADLLPTKDWSDYSIMGIRQKLAMRFDNLGAGQWEMNDYLQSYNTGKYLILYPTPTVGGDTVTVRYTAEHPLQGSNYFTVPTEHLNYVEMLLQAQALEVRGTRISSGADYFTAGTTRIRYNNSAKSINALVQTLRGQVRDALSVPKGRYA